MSSNSAPGNQTLMCLQRFISHSTDLQYCEENKQFPRVLLKHSNKGNNCKQHKTIIEKSRFAKPQQQKGFEQYHGHELYLDTFLIRSQFIREAIDHFIFDHLALCEKLPESCVQ